VTLLGWTPNDTVLSDKTLAIKGFVGRRALENTAGGVVFPALSFHDNDEICARSKKIRYFSSFRAHLD
jgi:hypothetical protein